MKLASEVGSVNGASASGTVFNRLADDVDHQESVATGCGPSWKSSVRFFHVAPLQELPKIATMESSRTEPQPRGIYCGTIVSCFQVGDDFNVAIFDHSTHKGQANMELAEDYLG